MAYYKQDSLSIKSRTVLSNILSELILISDSIQVYREQLAHIYLFNSISLFRYLDQEEKGYLREKDFYCLINSKHRKLLTYAFSWFDNMKVGQISRLQFATFLLPRDHLQLRQIVAKRVQNPQTDKLSQDSIVDQLSVFTKLLTEIMTRQMKVIQLRRQLLKCEDYSLQGVSAALDQHQNGWVCTQDLQVFLSNYGVDVNIRSVQKFVEIVNWSMDGKITQEQLRWIFQGFQNGEKGYLIKVKDSNKKSPSKTGSIKRQSKYQRDSPQTKEFMVQQPINSQLNDRYLRLVQTFKASQAQQKYLDKLLLQQQQQINYEIDKQKDAFLCDFKLQIEKINKQRQIVKQKQIALLEQSRRNQMIEEQKLKQIRDQNILQEKIYQNRIDQERRNQINKEKHREQLILEQIKRKYQSKRNNFSDNKKQTATFRSQMLMPAQQTSMSPPRKRYSPLKRDYANLSNLSRLTQVQSHRRPTQRGNINSQDTAYLSEANHLKEMLREQREKQKQIQQRLNSNRYNSKYSSRSSFFRSNQVPSFSKEMKGSIPQQMYTTAKRVSSPSKTHFSTANHFATSGNNMLY